MTKRHRESRVTRSILAVSCATEHETPGYPHLGMCTEKAMSGCGNNTPIRGST